MANRWQSIAVLGTEDNFSRLRKSYATMRKSFRLQLSDKRDELSASWGLQQYNSDDSDRKRSLMGHLSSGAAKLLRGVYAKGQRAQHNQTELDSCRFTDGSFKVLSPTSMFYESSTTNHHEFKSTPLVSSRKSNAELEIEQRLRRSRRRVLPSAQYKAPESEKACDGLNMDELEEIKRDNLRLTLLKSQRTNGQLVANHKPDLARDSLESSSAMGSSLELACSCKDISDPGQEHQEEPLLLDSNSHDYCTCTSILSSLSSSLDQLIEFDGSRAEEDETIDEPRAKDNQSRASSLDSAQKLAFEPQAMRDEFEVSGECATEPVGSGGCDDGDKIEDKLKAMFDSMAHDRMDFLSSERDFWLGNGCGNVEEEMRIGKRSLTSSIRVRSSPRTEQQQLVLSLRQQRQDYEECNQPITQQESGNDMTRAQDHSCAQHQQQQHKQHNNTKKMEFEGSSGSELMASKLGGVNLNGQVAAITTTATAKQQVSSRGSNNSSSNTSSSSNGGQSNENKTHNNKASACAYSPPSNSTITNATATATTSITTSTTTDQIANFKSNNDNAIELVVAGKQQLACAATITHQCMNQREENKVVVSGSVGKQQRHLIKEQASQTLDQIQTTLQNDQLVRRSSCRSIDAKISLTPNQAQCADHNASIQTKDHNHQYHQQQKVRTSRRHQEVMVNQTGEKCACRKGYGGQERLCASKQNLTDDRYLKNRLEDEHLYASINGSLTPSPERKGRQEHLRQADSVHHNHQINYAQKWKSELEQDYVYDSNEQSSKFKSDELQQYSQFYQQHLNNMQDLSMSQNAKHNKTKRSLFGRLKDMIVPTGRGNKQALTSYEWAPDMQSDDLGGCGGTLKLKPRRVKSSHWQRSATLTSKSAQNLKISGSSFRYLSNSKKSINSDDNEDNDDESDIYKNFRGFESTRTLTSSGFVTMGRRNGGQQVSGGKRQLANNIFRVREGRQLEHASSRFGGSADSLPSADSGLSCSNLQNSGSSDDNYAGGGKITAATINHNLYSEGPYDVSQCRDERPNHQVLGKAQALVDCNPCAYDREALVFKRGDIIDIIERSQTGTWVGHCNGKTGHFKFINVTELTGESEEETMAKEAVTDNVGHKLKSTRKTSSGYVTKLEIRSNNRNNNSEQLECKIETQSGSSTIDRRSKSLSALKQTTNGRGTLRQGEGGKTAVEAVETTLTTGHLRDSNETIMSSLEQLLFAIGLAGEQINRKVDQECNDEQDHWTSSGNNKMANDHAGEIENSTSCEKNSRSEWSYLDVLNKGGINNLDSFSAINDWHELEQIGIVDDEHQRRLLMAARIIRQASQAAKQDFVENYRTKSAGGAVAKANELSGQTASIRQGLASEGSVTPDVRKRTTTANKQQLKEGADKGNQQRLKSCVNEPIYVNLIRGAGLGTESIVSSEDRQNHDGQELMIMKLDQKQPANRSQLNSDSQRTVKSRCGHNHYHENQAERNNFHDLHRDGEGVKVNSINQCDHYQPRCCSNQNSNLFDTSLAESDGYYDYDVDNDYYDDGEDDECADNYDVDIRKKTYREESGRPNSTLSRNYSVRANSGNSNGCFDLVKSNQLNKTDHRDFGLKVPKTRVHTSSGQMIDELEVSSQSSRHSLSVDITSKLHSTSLAIAKRKDIVSSELTKLQKSNAHMYKYNCDWSDNTRQHTKDLRRPGVPKSNQHCTTSDKSTSNLGSQINSKSAYDLRLDLSHFFS